MKVTMTEAICQEGMALLDGKAEIFVAHDAHPHHYLDQLKDTDAFIGGGQGSYCPENYGIQPGAEGHRPDRHWI